MAIKELTLIEKNAFIRETLLELEHHGTDDYFICCLFEHWIWVKKMYKPIIPAEDNIALFFPELYSSIKNRLAYQKRTANTSCPSTAFVSVKNTGGWTDFEDTQYRIKFLKRLKKRINK